MADPHGTTPGRRTVLVLDPSEPALLRPAWSLPRRAAQIGQFAQAGKGASHHVTLLPSGAWALKPEQFKHPFEIIIGDDSPVIDLLQVIAANIMAQRLMQRLATDFTGVTITGAPAEDVFFEKQVPAGDTWASELPADVAAKPKPPVTSVTGIPMDRVIAGLETFGANTGFCLRFFAPASSQATPDVLATIYFGGPVGTSTPGESAGEFCATFFGDGSGELYELGALDWVLQQKFRFAPPGTVAGRAHTVFFIPHGNDRLEIIAGATDQASRPDPAQGATFGSGNVNPQSTTHNGTGGRLRMTGPGQIRIDQRRDLRFPYQISWLAYPATGLLVDEPFDALRQIPAGTPVYLQWHGDRPPGTSITVGLYDARTHVALSPQPDGSFLAPGGAQNRWYAQFAFASSNRKLTPTLRGYSVYVQARYEMREREGTVGGHLERVNINAHGGDPSGDSAQVTIQDLNDELDTLRLRGRRRAQIRDYYDTGDDDYSVLMDGEIPEAISERRGKPGQTFANWHKYEAPLIGMWGRVSDQINFQLRDFSADTAIGLDPSGNGTPWKITDIIRWIFSEGLGFPAAMLDVPDLSVRAIISAVGGGEFFIQPSADPLEFIKRMVREYLGYRLFWDPNAGEFGMWRVLPPPAEPYTVLYRFQTTHPGAGKLPHVQESYGAETFFAQHYTSWVRPPEANDITVTASGELLPNGQGAQHVNAHIWNPNSYDPTGAEVPEHPDKLDRYVPLVYFNSNIIGAQNSDEAKAFCGMLARRLYQQVATTQKWFRFRAPLVLVEDVSDPHQTRPRPLRHYDVIELDGHELIVQSNAIRIENDHVQWSEIEAMGTLGDDEYSLMAEFQDQYLRQQQRLAARPLGKDPRQDRSSVGNTRADGLENDIQAMPAQEGPLLQDEDGGFYFMFGLSPFGGADEFTGS